MPHARDDRASQLRSDAIRESRNCGISSDEQLISTPPLVSAEAFLAPAGAAAATLAAHLAQPITVTGRCRAPGALAAIAESGRRATSRPSDVVMTGAKSSCNPCCGQDSCGLHLRVLPDASILMKNAISLKTLAIANAATP